MLRRIQCWILACDGCSAIVEQRGVDWHWGGDDDLSDARETATYHGWHRAANADYCRACWQGKTHADDDEKTECGCSTEEVGEKDLTSDGPIAYNARTSTQEFD